MPAPPAVKVDPVWCRRLFRPRLATSGASLVFAEVLAHFEHAQEGLLRNLHLADPLHAALAFLLLFEQFALTADVTAVALGEHVLAQRADGFARHDLVADGRL